VAKKAIKPKAKTTTKKKDYKVGKGKPPKEHQFKKGQSGNPKGINISPEKRALKELTASSVADAIKKTLTCTDEEIQALLDDPKTPVGHKVILRAAQQAAFHGEYGKFDHILERAIGKVSVNINMNSNVSLGAKLEDKEKLKKVMKEVESEF
jgi:hypothetical protein